MFRSALADGGVVKALTVSGDGLSRARIDELERRARAQGAKGWHGRGSPRLVRKGASPAF